MFSYELLTMRMPDRDGSYYYKNANGSTYYDNGKGYHKYTKSNK